MGGAQFEYEEGQSGPAAMARDARFVDILLAEGGYQTKATFPDGRWGWIGHDGKPWKHHPGRRPPRRTGFAAAPSAPRPTRRADMVVTAPRTLVLRALELADNGLGTDEIAAAIGLETKRVAAVCRLMAGWGMLTRVERGARGATVWGMSAQGGAKLADLRALRPELDAPFTPMAYVSLSDREAAAIRVKARSQAAAERMRGRVRRGALTSIEAAVLAALGATAISTPDVTRRVPGYSRQGVFLALGRLAAAGRIERRVVNTAGWCVWRKLANDARVAAALAKPVVGDADAPTTPLQRRVLVVLGRRSLSGRDIATHLNGGAAGLEGALHSLARKMMVTRLAMTGDALWRATPLGRKVARDVLACAAEAEAVA